MRRPLHLAGAEIAPGERATVSLPIPRLYTHSKIDIPVHVIHGKRDGPRLFVSAAIHGDEINGVEIIRRLLRLKVLRRLRGTLLAVPVVNVFGFISQSRYLPDRRDLNRTFPGSDRGSLAGRVAKLFMDEVVAAATHGIDLHTGSNHRTNLPQIRACLDQPETERMAHAFGAPVIVNSNLRDGSLRQAALELKKPMLLYEAGEALRFNEYAIRSGLRGITRVMREIGMLPAKKRKARHPSVVVRSSTWVRAPISGVLSQAVGLGRRIGKDQLLAMVSDPFGDGKEEVPCPADGLIIGRVELPLVHQGDALFHVARVGDDPEVDAALEAIEDRLRPDDFQPGA